MKKIISLVAFCVFLSHGILFADNSARIKELTEEANKLIQEIQQFQSELQSKQVRVIEIQGALKELNSKPVDPGKGS